MSSFLFSNYLTRHYDLPYYRETYVANILLIDLLWKWEVIKFTIDGHNFSRFQSIILYISKSLEVTFTFYKIWKYFTIKFGNRMPFKIWMQTAMLMKSSSTNAYGLRRNTNQLIQNDAAQKKITTDITSGRSMQHS